MPPRKISKYSYEEQKKVFHELIVLFKMKINGWKSYDSCCMRLKEEYQRKESQELQTIVLRWNDKTRLNKIAPTQPFDFTDFFGVVKRGYRHYCVMDYYDQTKTFWERADEFSMPITGYETYLAVKQKTEETYPGSTDLWCVRPDKVRKYAKSYSFWHFYRYHNYEELKKQARSKAEEFGIQLIDYQAYLEIRERLDPEEKEYWPKKLKRVYPRISHEDFYSITENKSRKARRDITRNKTKDSGRSDKNFKKRPKAVRKCKDCTRVNRSLLKRRELETKELKDFIQKLNSRIERLEKRICTKDQRISAMVKEQKEEKRSSKAYIAEVSRQLTKAERRNEELSSYLRSLFFFDQG
ncbi:hypothetical protein GF382_01120 [Candidatus Falkowbacteria bacterium]|nr:hypothetical protein [Candidatus Falkowbacteria bacterium]